MTGRDLEQLIANARVVELQPDDILLVDVDQPLTPDLIERLVDAFDGRRTVILDKTVTVHPDNLAAAGHLVPTMPMGTTCAVHTHREWVPIERHHIWPRGMGGPDVDSNKVSVCANGHYAIHEVIRRLMANDGHLPDGDHFGPKVKAYAVQGWTEAGKPTHGGSGE